MIRHVYSQFIPNDRETLRRMAVAQKTWRTVGWRDWGVRDDQLPRQFQENGKSVPYLKDLLDKACGVDEEDILVYTNSDICVATHAAITIATWLQDREAMYARRHDFHHRFTEPIPDDLIHTGHPYPGMDLMAFRVRWWQKHRGDFPDMLIAREAWDACMAVLIEETNRGTSNSCPHLIYHERHPSFWENGANRYSAPGQIHNLRLAWTWMTRHGQVPQTYAIRKV